jgi:hypothetical protein
MFMKILKRISGHKVRIGGTQHSGWLPKGATRPLPTPVRDVSFNLEIQFDGYGYLLCYVSQEGDLYGDTWHETLDDAEEAAAEDFGVQPDQWQDVNLQGRN